MTNNNSVRPSDDYAKGWRAALAAVRAFGVEALHDLEYDAALSAPAETTRVEGEQPWKCACGWRGTPSQMTVSNTLRTCPKCGGSGGLILDNPTSDSARLAAREWMDTYHGAFKTNQEREDALAAIISKHFAVTSEPWCESCESYHPTPRDAAHKTDLQCAAAPADNDAESKGESNA